MDKIERDGKVAVLYSPGYGAGWSTWADARYSETLCMDARIVGPVLAGDIPAAVTAALALVPDFYTGVPRTSKWNGSRKAKCSKS